MRNFAAALMVVASGCAFHVQGTTPPGDEPSPGATDPNAPPAGTGAPGAPATPPPTGGDPTPPSAPPATGLDAGTAAPGPDMRPAPHVANVGDACAVDGDCTQPGIKCFHTLGHGGEAISLPGGYCSRACDAKTACPTGSECIATFAGPFCMNVCPTAGCRSGYACCNAVNACGLDAFCSGPGGQNGQGGG